MKRILILLFLLIGAPAFGAVAYDNSASVTGSGVTSLSVSLTTTGSNTLVIQVISLEGSTVSSGSQNGVATASKANVTLTAGRGEMWFKAGVTSGLCEVVFVSASDASLGCMSFNGVDQTTPLGTATTNVAFDPSTACTVPANGLCADAMAEVAGSGGTHTVSGTQTKRIDVFDGTRSAVGGSTASTTGNMTWNNAGGYQGAITVPISAAAAAGTRKRTGPSVF